MGVPADTAPASVPRWWPWVVCLFLLLATALSYLDRQALSVAAPVVGAELGLDNALLGLLFSAFFWSYGFMHLFVGWILDRYNIRVTYPLFVALWSLAQIGSGLALGFRSLFAARFFLGTFETAGQTGAARIIARIMPGKDRALANGIMMSGGSLGAMISGPLMIGLANTIGWRPGFVLLGIAGLVWALAWVVWFRPPPEIRKRLQSSVGRGQVLAEEDRWRTILSHPRFWACVAGAAFAIPIIHISGTWIPTYLVQRWGLSLDRGLALCLFTIYLGMDLGFMSGGAVISFLVRRGLGVMRARKVVMAASAALMLTAAAVPLAPGVAAAVALLFLLNLGRASWGAIFLAFNQDISPGRISMIAGIMGCIGSFAGALMIGLIGILSEQSGFDIPFLLIALLALLGMFPVLLVRWDSAETRSESIPPEPGTKMAEKG